MSFENSIYSSSDINSQLLRSWSHKEGVIKANENFYLGRRKDISCEEQIQFVLILATPESLSKLLSLHPFWKFLGKKAVRPSGGKVTE